MTPSLRVLQAVAGRDWHHCDIVRRFTLNEITGEATRDIPLLR